MIDTGHGDPILIIPGIQGRWEWMAPAIHALAGTHRVLSRSLTDASQGSGSFDAFIDLQDAVLDAAGVPRATIVGVSFGGLIAARYAARRPERTAALVLVAAPSPHWRPDAQTATYVAHPWRSLPAFAARACRRLAPEVLAAKPAWPSRLQFFGAYAGRALRYPASPARMARWVDAWMETATDIAVDCARIAAPTLVITGEAHLDQVVPLDSTLEYLTLIPGAQHVTLAGTGHVGLVSKPVEFAAIIHAFTHSHIH